MLTIASIANEYMNQFFREENSQTIGKFYDRVFQRYETDVAIQSGSQTLTYAEFAQRSAKMANVFRSLGLGADDCIGVLMQNRIEYLVTQIAGIRAGAVVVPLNNQLTETELKVILDDPQLRTLVVDPARFETIQSLQQSGLVFNHLIGVTDDGDVPIGFFDYDNLISKADSTAPTVDQQPDDVGFVYYTGGTTGQPKGTMHTHAGILLSIYNHIYELDIRRSERMLLVTPLGHSAGLFALVALAQGGRVILQSSFDAESVLETIDAEQVSWVYLIPSMIRQMLDTLDSVDSEANSLETIAYGSAPISAARLEEGLDAFGDVFVQFYGLTEVPNLVTILPKRYHQVDNKEWIESVGVPAQLVDVTVFTNENEWGNDIGEIGIRAPYQIKGYLNREEQLTDRDWIRTGDVGRIDDRGRLYILDRIQDIIISDGRPVYSTVVEDVLEHHSDIRQVAVIGIPENQESVSRAVNRKQVEQSVKAVVVPTDRADLTVADIRSFGEDSLEPWQLPDSIDTVGQLPETPYGKIDKELLREPYW